MRSLVVDDEPAARARLTRLLAPYEYVNLVGEAQDGLEAVRKIEDLRPDLLFLDIELPGLTGFEVLTAVRESAGLPLVIFITGYDQHALAAFEANALSYLLKPVEPDRLMHALDRAHKLLSAEAERRRNEKHVLSVARAAPKTIRQVVCRKRDRLILVPPEEIFWFQAEDGVVKARTLNDWFRVKYQVSELAASLPEDMFFRARRETLVNVRRIREVRPYFKSGFVLIMTDAAGTEIVVSERQAPILRQQIPGL